MMTMSAMPPRNPARVPKKTPMMKATTTTPNPIANVYRPPWMIRASMSRPKLSVPNQWSGLGGCSLSTMLSSNGEAIPTKGPKRIATSKHARTDVPTVASVLILKNRIRSFTGFYLILLRTRGSSIAWMISTITDVSMNKSAKTSVVPWMTG